MAPPIIKTDVPFVVFSFEADADYLLARMIVFLGAAFQGKAGYFGQQACEKYLKLYQYSIVAHISKRTI